MEEKVTGKDLWCALQIVKNVNHRLESVCFNGEHEDCENCSFDGLFSVGSCAEMEDIDSEERAKLLIKMLEQMEEPKSD